jgi:hypothetical protein
VARATVRAIATIDSKSLTITACIPSRITATDNGRPGMKITSSGKITVVGLDAVDGAYG